MAGKKKKVRRRKAGHAQASGPLFDAADYIETQLPNAGDYIARIVCDCNRLTTVQVRRFSPPPLVSLGIQNVVFQPNSAQSQDAEFTSDGDGDCVKVAIVSVAGGFNGNISLNIDVEILTADGQFPVDAASVTIVRRRRNG